MSRIGSCQIPAEITSVILEYEGGLVSAFQLDYIGGIYIHVYRNILGWVPQPETHTERFLQLATTIYTSKQPFSKRVGGLIKVRKMRKHMLPWIRAFKNDLKYYLTNIRKRAITTPENGPKTVLDLMCEK